MLCIRHSLLGMFTEFIIHMEWKWTLICWVSSIYWYATCLSCGYNGSKLERKGECLRLTYPNSQSTEGSQGRDSSRVEPGGRFDMEAMEGCCLLPHSSCLHKEPRPPAHRRHHSQWAGPFPHKPPMKCPTGLPVARSMEAFSQLRFPPLRWLQVVSSWHKSVQHTTVKER